MAPDHIQNEGANAHMQLAPRLMYLSSISTLGTVYPACIAEVLRLLCSDGPIWLMTSVLNRSMTHSTKALS
jgi:hypothetical protein